MITRKPTPYFTFDAGAEYESFNGPFNENHGDRVALGYESTGGYMSNEYLETDDGSAGEQLTGRTVYEYRSANDNVVRISRMVDEYDGRYDDFFLLSDGIRNKTKNNEEGKNKGHLLLLTLTWKTSLDELNFTSTTNYSNSNFQSVLDYDFTELDMIIFNYDQDFNTFAQDLHLTNDSNEQFKWLAGLFLMIEEFDSLAELNFGDDSSLIGSGLNMIGGRSVESKCIAVFGQAWTNFAEKFELRGRLCLDNEDRKLDWTGLKELNGMLISLKDTYLRSDDWFGVMPSISLSYVIDENQQTYGSIDREYKAEDYAANKVTLEAVSEPVDSEYTLTYGVDYKGLLLDKKLELNCALFYINWTDMQVSVVDNQIAVMQNATEARSYGAEIEAPIKPIRGLDFFAGLGFIKREFDEYSNHISDIDLSGNDLPNANEYGVSLGMKFRHGSDFFGSLAGNFLDPEYLDEVKRDSYTLLNAQVGYETNNWALYLYGINLLDEEYLAHTPSVDAGNLEEPLTVSAQLTFQL